MYLPIGNDMSVRETSIIGIFDMDNTSTSKWTRAFHSRAEKVGEVVPFDDLPSSFILTTEYGMNRIFLSEQNTKKLIKKMSGEG